MTLPESIEPNVLRSTMGHFATGVAVVAGMDRTEPVGMSVQSLVSVSLEPPLVLFCPSETSTTWRRIAPTGSFAISVLGLAQRQLCSVFSRRGADRFSEVRWHTGTHGSPLLDDALAHIECTIHAVHDAGDHHIVLGRVLRVGQRPAGKPTPIPCSTTVGRSRPWPRRDCLISLPAPAKQSGLCL